MNSLAASRCCAPMVRRMYPRANPTPKHHTETTSQTMNNDLSFTTKVRIKNAGYVIRHKTTRMAMRERLGPSNPRISGFDRGGSNLRSANLRRSEFRLENQDFSLECWEFAVDDGGEGVTGSPASCSPPFWDKRRGRIRSTAGSSVG